MNTRRVLSGLLIGACAIIVGAADQPAADVEAVVGVVDRDERDHVRRFLIDPSNADDLSKVVGMNAINGLDRAESIRRPLIRVLMRIAADQSVNKFTREWAFNRLTSLPRSEDDEKTVMSFAEVLAKTDADVLQSAARDYLDESAAAAKRRAQLGSVTLRFFNDAHDDASAQDPRKQSEDARLKTLRQNIREAIQLLEAKKELEFFQRYIDPYLLARAAARSGETVDSLVKGMVISDSKAKVRHQQRILETLRRCLKTQPKWYLEGRAASFLGEQGSSRDGDFWIYLEGQWRISPES